VIAHDLDPDQDLIPEDPDQIQTGTKVLTPKMKIHVIIVVEKVAIHPNVHHLIEDLKERKNKRISRLSFPRKMKVQRRMMSRNPKGHLQSKELEEMR